MSVLSMDAPAFPAATVTAAANRVAATLVANVFMVFPSRVGEAVASKKEGNLSMWIVRRSDGGHQTKTRA